VNRSDNIDLLAKALVAMQAELKPVVNDATNPFFKSDYASYEAVRLTAQPTLAKYGLAVIHVPGVIEDGKTVLECVLVHESGQWLGGLYPLNPVKNDPQAMGSAQSYAKRYSFSSLIGQVTNGQDDDGNMASAPPPREKGPPPAITTKTKPAIKGKYLSEKQLKRLFAIASTNHWASEEVKQFYTNNFGITTSLDLNKEQYDELCAFIEKNPGKKSG
jgi:hypothetical protein